MANKVNVRVENKYHNPKGSSKDNYHAFKSMFSVFNKRVQDAGIIKEWKRRQYHESKGEKRRRKEKESSLERRKDQLRKHFGNRDR